MKKLLIVILLFVLCGTIGVQASTLAQADTSNGNVTEQTTPANQTESKGGGIDWMQVIFAGSYLLGVFVLFPLVVYTNYQEKCWAMKILISLKYLKTYQKKSEMTEQNKFWWA